MSELTREELFRQESQKLKSAAENADKKKGGNFNRDYEDISYVGLEDNKDLIVRLIGDPEHYERKSEYSPHRVLRARIIGDGDKITYVNFPDRYEGKNWILWKIVNKVLSYDWDSVRKEKVFKYRNSHPRIFNRVWRNDKVDNIMEKGWTPVPFVVMQGIDRLNYQWHVDNKKYKVISKKISVSKDGESEYSEYGVPPKLYDEIITSYVEHYGDWEKSDLALKRVVTVGKSSVKEYSYKARNAFKYLEELDESVRSFVSNKPLTEEEKSWQKYNIKKLCQVTSYTKILNRLGLFIQEVDKAFGTSFYTELETLVKEEKANWDKLYGNTVSENNITNDSIVDTNNNSNISNSAVNNKPINARQTKSIFQITEKMIEEFPGLGKISESERKLITGIDNGKFTYSSTNLVECNVCKFIQPFEIESHCIGCGGKF